MDSPKPEPTSTAAASANAPSPVPAPVSPPHPSPKKGLARPIIGCVVLVLAVIGGIYWYIQSQNIVSTDDAYVDGHVTFVAPRVAGQIARVLVEDNNRVHKGDLLVQIDTEPYVTQVNIAKAALTGAEADLVAAQAQAHGTAGQMRSLRFNLQHAIEDVDNQVALLRSKIAALQSQKASLDKAQADYDRAVPLVSSGTVSKEEFDLRKEALEVGHAHVEEALQGVYQVRVSLGLPPRPESGDDLAQVPVDIDQTFSSVRQAQASLIQAAAFLGVTDSLNISPKQMVENFYKRDPSGDVDRIYDQLMKDAPVVKQAEAKIATAQRNLDESQLNLRYCDVVAEIDGVVTRREVNPGNNVVVGQGLMALRSLSEIWIDANFKETQLARLRIGQSADLEVDMYGKKQYFKGRVSGFTMGTGSTLALLPAENATGNFVKVVQRLPVRIEVLDYDPDKTPLFVGLSVIPHIHVNEQPTGPDAGAILQPYLPTRAAATMPETQP